MLTGQRDTLSSIPRYARTFETGFNFTDAEAIRMAVFDSQGSVASLYLMAEQVEEKASLQAAVFVADRWGEIFSHTIVKNDQDLPTDAEIREWLEFIELQCEECFPSEWPV